MEDEDDVTNTLALTLAVVFGDDLPGEEDDEDFWETRATMLIDELEQRGVMIA
ncbi:MAG: hypothetical protein UY48_C0031G0006 [Candidatus Gottesmanbacteria bacterium GW2011_GWB1_49_7]|uniref:Uncharacterized protein n=1 Tax=Candidatus Gottesmanbacteria bacterium GW2011_GWB1_49_7 TaxID=1618448 RepID=A0A0G1Y7B1_9BACT|nr:MAG: hypothetical protein UY48_C0031G0006 [Candidatus Gottesmanbacteria bacterium GW2011_GWB1_49_7]